MQDRILAHCVNYILPMAYWSMQCIMHQLTFKLTMRYTFIRWLHHMYVNIASSYHLENKCNFFFNSIYVQIFWLSEKIIKTEIMFVIHDTKNTRMWQVMYSFEWGKMQRSIWPLDGRKPRLLNESQSLIGISAAIVRSPGCYRNNHRSETHAQDCACALADSLRNTLSITLFEQKKPHLWHSCCLISLVISNMEFNRKLSEQFWRMLCFPIQSDRSCTWMPESCFKDGRRVTGLWILCSVLCFTHVNFGKCDMIFCA